MSQSADKRPLAYGQMRDKLTPDDTEGKTAVLTIASAERRNFAPEGQGEEYKIVLTFDEFPEEGEQKEKEYIVNATSYKTLVTKLGENEDEWIGQPCVMAPTTTNYGGKTFEKIHVASPERWDKVMAAQKKASKAK